VNAALRKLAIRILGLVIEGLGVSPKQFEAYVEEAEGSIGARYYHRSPGEVVVGLHAHVDWNLISIVHQHEIGGLQVLKDQQWYSIPPRPDSFAINVGDCLQVCAPISPTRKKIVSITTCVAF
jgi:isopenicillin N synthase-like dioxygenase